MHFKINLNILFDEEYNSSYPEISNFKLHDSLQDFMVDSIPCTRYPKYSGYLDNNDPKLRWDLQNLHSPSIIDSNFALCTVDAYVTHAVIRRTWDRRDANRIETERHRVEFIICTYCNISVQHVVARIKERRQRGL